VDLTFGDADLARLCNCERRMVQRWGDDGFRQVGRRLLELAALSHHTEIDLLPSVSVERRPRGSVTVEFDGGELVIRGVLTSASANRNGFDSDGLRITSVSVHSRRSAR
jgi:hypothetical protein